MKYILLYKMLFLQCFLLFSLNIFSSSLSCKEVIDSIPHIERIENSSLKDVEGNTKDLSSSLNNINRQKSCIHTIWFYTCICVLIGILLYAICWRKIDTVYCKIQRRHPHSVLAIPVFICIYIMAISLCKDHFESKNVVLSPHIEASILLITSILTFAAFWVQYRYNQSQRNDLEKERFENKFFNFLDLLQVQEANAKIENVGEGKQAFHFMFYEFKAILYLLYKSNVFGKLSNRGEIELAQAFHLFLNGVSKSSMSRILEKLSMKEKEKIKKINIILLKYQSKIRENKIEKPKYLKDYGEREILLFDGHRLRLVSYYRTACMLIQYIFKSFEEKSINEKERLFYLNLFLSQLSEHEIALLRIIYLFDFKDNEIFILENYQSEVNIFFRVELLKYIKSKTMNIEHNEFIDRD